MFAYIIWCFYDQSDDIVEYILGILPEFATKINVVTTQDDISKLVDLKPMA